MTRRNLAGNGLTGSIPSTIGQFPALFNLFVVRCHVFFCVGAHVSRQESCQQPIGGTNSVYDWTVDVARFLVRCPVD
jgi:hypothetical protein